MATTVSDGDGSVGRYRSAQGRVIRALLRDMRRLRRLIVPSRLQATLPDWIAAVQDLTGQYGGASAALGADFYEAQRAAAGVGGVFSAPVPGAPPDEQIEASLRWATKDVWPRDPEDPTTTVAQLQPLKVRLEQAEKKAEAVVTRLVLGQGRQTVREAVQRDREAVAYARAAALGACSFCKLMAARGATYKSLDSVGREANERFVGEDSVIKFHNSCRCQPIPVFRGQRFQLSPQASEWDRIYRQYAAPFPGEQLARFRRALAEHDQYPLPGTS
ncbi:hypothetical protein [Streptomyces sp. SAJ15]|uniref:VG15 protein n=1 Tax=Streptomyces sp. SAJ15 TaxID=2011095 RepID=UPI001185C577|nr:hypothetical protein [Streptomyces sp. SAJ15]TVL89745.1 hypothetical protein CD790_25440 [Streptomyces sp. SAJ15]